jgi:hypothetical protein
MGNSFEDKVDYLAGLTEYSGMADIDPLLKAHAGVFNACVTLRDGDNYMGKYNSTDIELLWDLVCQVLQMDATKEYLDWENHPSGDAFMVEFYKAKGKIV